MAKDVSFFLAQVTGALVVNAAEAMALADALQEKVATLEAQVQTLTADRLTEKAAAAHGDTP